MMNPEQWSAIDSYIDALYGSPDPALESAIQESAAAGLPSIHVSPVQGRLLHVLATLCGARRILEIGTLGGYSTIWLARALADGGSLITLEANPRHADVARANIARAGLASRVEIRLGPALETLPKLAAENGDSFDLVFIDADKENLLPYFDWALRLTRRGGLIVADNVIRQGAILESENPDVNVQGARRFNAGMASDKRVTSTILQVVGSKGYDGLAFAVVMG